MSVIGLSIPMSISSICHLSILRNVCVAVSILRVKGPKVYTQVRGTVSCMWPNIVQSCLAMRKLVAGSSCMLLRHRRWNWKQTHIGYTHW